ncbi:hypothetical protein AMTRI_Chr12g234430 [Amborella trichopoda]
MGKAFYSICVALLYALLPLEGSVNAERIRLQNINTTRDVHANYLPYGENAVEFFCKPSGRFSDGRLITDFISELANLPLISPYLQPHADLSYGANLGSVAAGIVVEIYRGKMQVNQFVEFQEKLRRKLGSVKSEELFSNAIGYEGILKLQLSKLSDDLVRIVIGNLSAQTQVLFNHGARKFLFMSLKDIGCLPGMCLKTQDGSCFAPQLLIGFASKLVGLKYIFFDHFMFIKARTQGPIKYGFSDGLNVCCGTGPFWGLTTCGGTYGAKIYHLCRNVSTHVLFDSFHYTQGAIWEGKDQLVRPLPLKHFFMDETSQVSHGKAKIASTHGCAMSKSI